MKYYYFVTKGGLKSIKITNYEINTVINKNYDLMTEEQVEFYEEHPTASVNEVMNCRLNEPIVVAQQFDLEDYKDAKLKEISNLSLQTLGKFVSEYQLMNARLSLEAEGDDKIYDDAKSRHYIDTYLRVGKQCRELYYAAVADFEDAQTKEEVDNLYNQYKESYGEVD